jgi:predicted transcriptional regulator
MQALEGKRGILAALEQALQDDAALEDAIDYLLYLQGIEEGLEDERAGRMVPHEEIVEMIKLENDPQFLSRIEKSRGSLRAGKGLNLENIE